MISVRLQSSLQSRPIKTIPILAAMSTTALPKSDISGGRSAVYIILETGIAHRPLAGPLPNCK